MIELTNLQIIAFDTPAMTDLLNSKERQFPIDDAFRLADIVETLVPKIKAYRKTVRKIIDTHKGTTENGVLKFPSDYDEDKANVEIETLNETVTKCQITKVKKSDKWPALTIAEARVLKPVTILK